jgi:hypothetical protein
LNSDMLTVSKLWMCFVIVHRLKRTEPSSTTTIA